MVRSSDITDAGQMNDEKRGNTQWSMSFAIILVNVELIAVLLGL